MPTKPSFLTPTRSPGFGLHVIAAPQVKVWHLEHLSSHEDPGDEISVRVPRRVSCVGRIYNNAERVNGYLLDSYVEPDA
jgi:hypothetical protein